MKKGFSLIEILVALAIFGLLSGLVLSSLLGLFRTNRAASNEARAVTVAKNYLEIATRQATYSASGNSYLLTLPAPTQTAGFQVTLEAGGRLASSRTAPLSSCTLANNSYTCSVSCSKNGSTVKCGLVTVKLTLSSGSKSYTFYREWAP